ncbi:Abscisic acid-insensitive 5-like protein [Thalictrum thalictroides]|uniref:Abscisic acid-insensitive 5-like protein n=1 Tax=Thalictrum thalictroides TaxID=46969 RepID=A0A7J6USF5_THATH|nr:Abscisic acid-insensitive 5-like protein [Thalictrum thalictroides]
MGSQSNSAQHQHSQFLPLSRQTSFYSLTLDEVQNQLGLGALGKPLGSMNLDELLKNVCSAADDTNDAAATTSALQHQPSLSKKTVDEVWRDIQQGQAQAQDNDNNNNNNPDNTARDRQPTLGEMTLEDFLVKAGIVSQGSSDHKATLPLTGTAPGTDLMITSPQTPWLQYQLPSVQQQQQQPQQQQNMMGVFIPGCPLPQSLPIAQNNLLEPSYPENQLAISSPLIGNLSDTQTPGRKRGPSGDLIEKTVERRQKRMIKNRESAARSRARKQTMGSQSNSAQHQHSQFLPLSRQTSFYSLTLDEVQNQLGLGALGKPLGSMNLDELLKNVCSAADDTNDAAATTSALQHQPSLSKKTVDEVWRDIQQGQAQAQDNDNNNNNNPDNTARDRQPTLGEMTLEDFLVKAGIVSQGSSDHKATLPLTGTAPGTDLMITSPQTPWLQYQLPSVQQQQQQPQQQQNMMGVFIPGCPLPQSLPIAQNNLLEPSYPENQLAISSPLIGNLSDTQTPGRKRGPSGDLIEKTVERRQKRMIKNRESAARSRARKQAYTNELENKVSRLEEENARLKKQKKPRSVQPPPLEIKALPAGADSLQIRWEK